MIPADAQNPTTTRKLAVRLNLIYHLLKDWLSLNLPDLVDDLKEKSSIIIDFELRFFEEM